MEANIYNLIYDDNETAEDIALDIPDDELNKLYAETFDKTAV